MFNIKSVSSLHPCFDGQHERQQQLYWTNRVVGRSIGGGADSSTCSCYTLYVGVRTKDKTTTKIVNENSTNSINKRNSPVDTACLIFIRLCNVWVCLWFKTRLQLRSISHNMRVLCESRKAHYGFIIWNVFPCGEVWHRKHISLLQIGLLNTSCGPINESEDESNMEELDQPTDFKDFPARIDWNAELPANIAVPRVEIHSLVLDFAAVSFLDISGLKGLRAVRLYSCSSSRCFALALFNSFLFAAAERADPSWGWGLHCGLWP